MTQPRPDNIAAFPDPASAWENLRTPPHNIEAEQALLGAILVNNDALMRVQGFLIPEHFHEPVHRRIYDAAIKLIERGQLASPVTLKPFFENDEALRENGGAAYLARLAGAAVTIINTEDFGRTIADLHLRRQLILIGEEMVNTAYDSPIDAPVPEQIERAEAELFKLAGEGMREGGFESFAVSASKAVQQIEWAFKRDGKLSGITTGMRALDAQLGGLHRSDLVILAARPGMGKTSLATNIAVNAAKAYRRDMTDGISPKESSGGVVGLFSLEMSSDQLASRILSEASDISSHDLRRGKLKPEEFRELVRASTELADMPLYIDDTPALSISALRTRARRLQRTHGLGMVIVDYLQLMRGSGTGTAGENRVQEISEITRGLKALAKDLHVPVIALSQLSRAVESRDDKHPQLSDLRESGSIEQDADVVLFIYREEYYLQNREPPQDTDEHRKWVEQCNAAQGVAEVIVAKQRHGPTGIVRLHFNAQTTKFGDLALSDYTDYGEFGEQSRLRASSKLIGAENKDAGH